MMTKLMTAAILTLLCAPALADTTAPPSPPPPPTAGVPLELHFAISDGAGKRSLQISVVGNDCGEIVDEQAGRSDVIRACAKPTTTATELLIDWNLRANLATPAQQITFRGKSSILVAPHGSYSLAPSLVLSIK